MNNHRLPRGAHAGIARAVPRSDNFILTRNKRGVWRNNVTGVYQATATSSAIVATASAFASRN